MPRNLFRRVESMFPIEDPELRDRTRDELLGISFSDTAACWRLRSDGTYEKVAPEDGAPARRSQLAYIEQARKAGLKSIPYESALRQPRNRPSKKRRKKSNA
jgi:polyphosphate kinase